MNLLKDRDIHTVRKASEAGDDGLDPLSPHFIFCADQGVVVLQVALTVRCTCLEPDLPANCSINKRHQGQKF